MKISPTTKVAGAGAGGTLGVVVVWFLSLVGVDVPTEVAVALGSLLSTLVAWLVSDMPKLPVGGQSIDA